MNAAGKSPDEEESPPLPRRFWWLKRLITLTLLLAVLWTVVFFTWSWRLQSRLESTRSALRAEFGDPSQAVPRLPDSQNAAALLMAATASLKYADGQEDLIYTITTESPPTEASLRGIGATLANNPTNLSAVRSARNLKQADWGVRFGGPSSSGNYMSFVYRQREIVALLHAAAIHAHYTHHDDQCLDYLLDIEHIADCVGQIPNLAAYLVANETETHVLTNLDNFTSDLDLTTSRSRELAAQLSAHLADSQTPKQELQRCTGMEAFEALAKAELYCSRASLFIPLFYDQAIRANDGYAAMSRAIENPPPNHPNFPDRRPGFRFPNQEDRPARVLRNEIFFSATIDFIEQSYFDRLRHRRNTAKALAARTQQFEHSATTTSSPQH